MADSLAWFASTPWAIEAWCLYPGTVLGTHLLTGSLSSSDQNSSSWYARCHTVRTYNGCQCYHYEGLSLLYRHFTNLSKQFNQKMVIKFSSLWWKCHNSVINMQWKCWHHHFYENIWWFPVTVYHSEGYLLEVNYMYKCLQTVLFVVQYGCLCLKMIVLIFLNISCHHICKYF